MYIDTILQYICEKLILQKILYKKYIKMKDNIQKLLGIENIDENKIDELTNEQLVLCFNQLWTNTKGAFIDKYSINKGNFSRWAISKKLSRASQNAVKQWLKEELNKEIYPFEFFTHVNNQNTFTPLSFKDFRQSLDTLIINRIVKNELKYLVFIDGDQAQDQVYRLQWLVPDVVKWNVYVFITFGSKTKIPVYLQKHIDWCTVVQCQGSTKNAADYVIIQEIAIIVDRLEHTKINDKVNIIVVTMDLFSITLKEEINCDNNFEIVNSSTLDLGFYLLSCALDANFSPKGNLVQSILVHCKSYNDIPNVLKELSNIDILISPNQLIATLEHNHQLLDINNSDNGTMNIIPDANLVEKCKQSPNLPKIKEKLASRGKLSPNEIGQCHKIDPVDCESFKCKNWNHLLQHPAVLLYLEAKIEFTSSCTFYLIVKSNTDQDSCRAKNVCDMNDDDLRNLFTGNWKGTVEEFCQIYNIHQGNFKSWKHKRRIQDPTSSSAVRLWVKQKLI
jgi:hypothetical protein